MPSGVSAVSPHQSSTNSKSLSELLVMAGDGFSEQDDAFCSRVAVALQQNPVLMLSHGQQGPQAAGVAALNELFQQLQRQM
ncbi:hypothetical protein EYF80_002086 [Liparis tanakae]|uniref:Uncharacterized protein n=1 Tax=Liparis tanakae TaxID=230148 RepID=A0A4Z2JBY6_9TELE|nr:hypothetical protein EYF80_002086 [Liparis tanakae]